LKTRYRGEFKAALEHALVNLASEQRNLLRLHFVDGLRLEDLARLFHVDRSTVVRRIAAAREAIVDEAKRLLQERLDIDAAEFESLIGLVRSRLDLSLPSLWQTRVQS
jgi:RNA polymerase sigma-70 factor (ECF subfamily)